MSDASVFVVGCAFFFTVGAVVAIGTVWALLVGMGMGKGGRR